MTVYLDVVILLNFAVDFLLLYSTNRLCGFSTNWLRTAFAALLGGVYAGMCMLPGLDFLGKTIWRLLFLIFICSIAFGMNKYSIRKCAIFILLSMALGGVALGVGQNGFFGLMLSCLTLCGLCFLGFRGKLYCKQFVQVLIRYKEKSISLIALRDTGNMLKDPISAESVMIVDADVAKMLVGIDIDMLNNPIIAMQECDIPGLRLIPYRAVGKTNGMLLALRVDEVRIDGVRGGNMVAFAPQRLGNGEGYQALTGGL